jgi:hypothetical protein
MKERISNSECLDCGHIITDHHQARTGWHNGVEWRGEAPRREKCIGDRGTCPCRKFAHGHERKIMVMRP